MGFAGTKRNVYSSEKVREMRNERKTKKAKVDGIDDATYQHYLGDLLGAGHLKIGGFTKMDIEMTKDITGLGISLGMGNPCVSTYTPVGNVNVFSQLLIFSILD